MITGTESLSEIFSVFHDGGIARYSDNGNNLELEIEIMYLAQRVDPAFRSFRVLLHNVQCLSFSTWPKDSLAGPTVFQSPTQIFEPELEILSGEFDGEQIKVICSQPSSEFSYCGGELCFSASSALVTDEAGKIYTIDDLHQLCEEYWDEWRNKNK